MRPKALAILLAAAFMSASGVAEVRAGQAGAGEMAVSEPSGYRLNDYRAPTPAGLANATTVSNEKAMALWKSKAVLFIDVLPRLVRPANLPAGTIWRQPERLNIPGSVWLPNTGYGVLSPAAEAYFSRSLARLTKANKDQPILIYCLENCWMSWNAAKRALKLGYHKVYWYPAGTDGWTRIGGDLESAEPLADDG
jgi:PQQ-dependent catabolism-associated CXXCW motif protein